MRDATGTAAVPNVPPDTGSEIDAPLALEKLRVEEETEVLEELSSTAVPLIKFCQFENVLAVGWCEAI
jgi:hypothetical protein